MNNNLNLLKLDKQLIQYVSEFKKQKKLSKLKKGIDCAWIDSEWMDTFQVENHNKFVIEVHNALLQHNYTGNMYKFTFNFEILNNTFDNNYLDLCQLPLKDTSNLLSLFIFQRFTKIFGIEVAFFSLVDTKLKKNKIYFTFEGYFVVSEWYDVIEKKRIITSIYSILSNKSLYDYSLFDDINFDLKQVSIKNFKKNFKVVSKEWKINFIYLFYFGLSSYNYELSSSDTILYDATSNIYTAFNIIDTTLLNYSVKPLKDEWDILFSTYFVKNDFIKSSPLILFILGELNYTKPENINFSKELEQIYDIFFKRINNNSYLFNIRHFKSQNFLKMYYIYFIKNNLCFAWNGVYQYNEMANKLTYYCSFYKIYKKKTEIRKWINKTYNFNYIDKTYLSFSLFDLLKLKKKLPQEKFFSKLKNKLPPVNFKMHLNTIFFSTFNSIKSLFFKCRKYVFFLLVFILIFFISLFPVSSVYAMEHIHLWKNSIYYTSGQFDFKLLRHFIFNNYNIELTNNNLREVLIQNQLQGLFNKPHIFFIYNNLEVLSSLTHFENNKCILISNYDYKEKNNTQHLGEPFDYAKNKIFFKSRPNIFQKDRLIKYLLVNESNMFAAFKKQSFFKPINIANVVLDNINSNGKKILSHQNLIIKTIKKE